MEGPANECPPGEPRVALDEVGREPVDRLPRGWFEHSAARLSSPSAGEHLARVYSGLAPVRSARRAVQQTKPKGSLVPRLARAELPGNGASPLQVGNELQPL